MKILHITAHLGGGVGKAHAAIAAADMTGIADAARMADAALIERHYAVLEDPRDRRFADALMATGARMTIAPDRQALARLAADADIVQIEWWNHPRIYDALCRTDFPAMRTLFWSHISGLFAPFVPEALLPAAGRFAFTSPCSLVIPEVLALPQAVRAKLAVVNSGFGFAATGKPPAVASHPRRIACLGTLDFVKLSPELFDVVDGLVGEDIVVSLWGSVDPQGAVMRAHARMRHPERIRFEGHASDPQAVLAGTGIFLYLLQPQHYGTAENALVEAMSVGAVPLAFANPAESAIIRHGETGFLEADAVTATKRLQWMLDHPDALVTIAQTAMADVAMTRTPEVSAQGFRALYADILNTAKTTVDFAALLGSTPAYWFLSTQIRGHRPGGDTAKLMNGFLADGTEAKGSLAHFRGCFPGDLSLGG